MDYHIIGFRECASEVARYLINIEGMDIQDPLRMRLMSHLQCFVAQRELSAKTTTAATNTAANWGHSSYQTNYAPGYHQNYPGHTTNTGTSSGYVPLSSVPVVPAAPLEHHSASHTATSTSSTTVTQQSSLLADHTHAQQSQTQQPADHHHQHQDQQQQQHHYNITHDVHADHQTGSTYTDLSASNIQRNTAASIGYGNPQYPSTGAQGYGQQAYNANGSKPYRPWGAEMAY